MLEFKFMTSLQYTNFSSGASLVAMCQMIEIFSNKIENIQATSLKVILSENYVGCNAALEMCDLENLSF